MSGTIRSDIQTDARLWPGALVTTLGIVPFALLTALAAQIRLPLPFTPVPVTLQVFTVVLAGYVLGARAGAASLGLYLLMGTLGTPVFSGGGAGWGILTGFTGGYLLASPLAALVVGRLSSGHTGWGPRLLAGLTGLGVIHAGGALWLAFMAPQAPSTLPALLTWSFLPFIGLDVVKVMLAERLSRLFVRP